MKLESENAADAQPGGGKHHFAAGIALTFVGIVLAALLVLPGFLAAGFS